MGFVVYRLHLHAHTVSGAVFLGTTLEVLVSFFKGDEQVLAQTTSVHPLTALHLCGQQQCSVF